MLKVDCVRAIFNSRKTINNNGFISAINQMNLLKLNLNHRPHHHISSFRHRLERIKLSQNAQFVFFPACEQKLKLLVSYGTPYESCSRGSGYINLHDIKPFSIDKEKEEFEEYLAEDGEVYQKTLRLVECAMFAAVSGLAFLLSNSLAIEKYFTCFSALPIVLSTMRWGVAAGRKTMVATSVLLFVLSGPVKAVTYLVRAVGAVLNVIIASYLIRENILALITINVHSLFTYILSSIGIISVPSMNLIYFIFGVLLLLNCASFVFLLHLLYAVFLQDLG